MKYNVLGIICFLFFSTALFAQSNNTEAKKNPGIQVKGRALKDKIMLRWAPDSPLAWQFANKYGFVIEKYTILKDGKLTTPIKKEILTPSPIKPWPLEKWEALAEEDEYAAVAAEALYTDKFELTENFTSDIVQVMQKAKEIDTRFSFALFAADQSMKAAIASALAYTDEHVVKDEKYLYKVYSPIPNNLFAIDTGFVYVGVQDYLELPAPEGLTAELNDKMVMLQWEGFRYKDFYNSFSVERSDDDGKTFHPIAHEPVVNTDTDKGDTPQYMVKLDSLPTYNKKYLYRVKGISFFGEQSPPSDTLSVVAHQKFIHYPRITGTEVRNGNVKINWQFPEAGKAMLKGFQLSRADKVKGELVVIADHLAPGQRFFIDPKPHNSNYYTLTAFDQYGNRTSSLPSLAMLEDSIPPMAPINLAGKIDSLGIVSVTWKANIEDDVLGYRVYRSNFVAKEFVQVTVHPKVEPLFQDTIELKTLTSKIYYKVVAIDKHYNPSVFSLPLELERPDIVPPAAPVFQSIQTDENGIHLQWINSSSTDVDKHVIYRRSATDKGWVPLSVFLHEDSVNHFRDSLSDENVLYAYTLIAVDKHGLESAPAIPVSMKRGAGKKPGIKYITAQADRRNNSIKLSWQYDQSQTKKYLIYRAKQDDVMQLYKILDGPQREFSDNDLRMNATYRYRVQAEYDNGARSPFSKEIVVNY